MTSQPARIVLIVEDSENCAVTLQVALETLPGVELRVAGSAAAALEMIERDGKRVAAVITDLQLPGMSGLDLIARLRAETRFQSLPVLMISGASDPRLPEAAIAQGAAAFFAKPYSPGGVRKKLEQLLG